MISTAEEEPDTRIDYSHVGRISDLVVNQLWAQVGVDVLSNWAALKGGGDPTAEEAIYLNRGIKRFSKETERLRRADLWHPRTHDRRVELVFIGDHRMQRESIEAAVESAMLTHEETQSFVDSWEAKAESQGTASAAATATDSAPSNPFISVPRCVTI